MKTLLTTEILKNNGFVLDYELNFYNQTFRKGKTGPFLLVQLHQHNANYWHLALSYKPDEECWYDTIIRYLPIKCVEDLQWVLSAYEINLTINH